MARRVALFATCLIDALFPDAGRATVDIEMVRVRGVHGPRRLEVVLVMD